MYPFNGTSFGGAQVSVLNMIKKLDKKIYKPIVFLHNDGILRKILVREKIDFILNNSMKIPSNNSLLNFFFISISNTLRMKKIFNKYNIDIVHVNDFIMHTTWNIPSLVFRKKFIWHIRSKDNSKRLILYSFFANKIIAVSEFCKKNIPKPFNRKISVIKNFFSETNHKISNTKDYFNISYVANFKSQKRPDLFFKVINEILLMKKDIRIKFYIFGEVESYQKKKLLDILSLKKFSKNIRFKGHQFPIDRWLKQSDMTISLGINEGFGRVIIEAMLNKTLVVATNGGGHDEIIKHGKNGILAYSDDPKTLANLMVYYLTNRKLSQSIIEKAFQSSRNKFIINNKIKNITDIYENLFLLK